MQYLFLLLFLASIIFAVVGFIKPNFLQSYIKHPLTRRQNLLIYGLSAFVAFAGVGISAPVSESQEMNTVSVVQEIDTAAQDSSVTVSNEMSTQTNSEEVMPESVLNDSFYPVSRVIDGDTIEVLIGGEKKIVRYIGIDTPETVHPSKPVECFGAEASNRNKELVEGKSVRLVKDISETDTYGRLLRYVYVNDVFVNLDLVQSGYANASSYPPDVAFNEDFRNAEQDARAGGRGLWGDACNTESGSPTQQVPATITTPVTQTQTSGQCTIKGNINSDDEKIYHVVGCGSYSKTVIDEAAGEKWFCTEGDALNAGWRKALNC